MPDEPTKGKIPPPTALCLLVCDQIIVDQGTNNRNLIGMFSNIWARSFPAVHPRITVYAELTNGHGASAVKISLIDANADDLIWSTDLPIDFPDPRMIANLQMNLNNVLFPQPSEYRFQLWADGELLTERRILVAEMPKPPEETQQ